MKGEKMRGAAFGLCLLLVGCTGADKDTKHDTGTVSNTATGGSGSTGVGGASGATTSGGSDGGATTSRGSGGGATSGSGGAAGAAGAMPGEASIVFIDPLPEHVDAAEAVSDGVSHAVLAAASADQQVLVGVSAVARGTPITPKVFRWTRAGGAVPVGGLPDAPEPRGLQGFNAMTADGSVILGTTSDADSMTQQVARWTEQTGTVALGPWIGSYAWLSDDGAAVAYTNNDGMAVRWTEDGGLQTLPALFEGEFYYAYAIHPDGTEVYGQTRDDNVFVPWRWKTQRGTEAIALPEGVDDCALSVPTSISHGFALVIACAERRSFVVLPESGVVEVPDLEDYPLYYISAVSKDGSVVFGAGADLNVYRAVRFTVETGTVALLPDQRSSSMALGREAISLDGSVAIGTFVAADGSDNLFRWEEGRGYIELLPPEGYELPELTAVRPDGDYVVGSARLDDERVPVIWDRTGAPHVLATYLSAAGLDLGDNVLTEATFRTETGLLFGNSLGSTGRIRAFVATLP